MRVVHVRFVSAIFAAANGIDEVCLIASFDVRSVVLPFPMQTHVVNLRFCGVLLRQIADLHRP